MDTCHVPKHCFNYYNDTFTVFGITLLRVETLWPMQTRRTECSIKTTELSMCTVCTDTVLFDSCVREVKFICLDHTYRVKKTVGTYFT